MVKYFTEQFNPFHNKNKVINPNEFTKGMNEIFNGSKFYSYKGSDNFINCSEIYTYYVIDKLFYVEIPFLQVIKTYMLNKP